MAEERDTVMTTTSGSTATSRAITADDSNNTTGDEELSKEELQRRMEEARENISQTVAEIKDTVTTQYESVRENINEALDWREQYRKHPAAFVASAAGVGLLLGLSLGGVVRGGSSDDYDATEDYDVYDYDDGDEDDYTPTMAARNARSSSYEEPQFARTSSSAAYSTASSNFEQPKKPGLIERFKETGAYEKLINEVSTLGNRAAEELSRTAQTVVLPMLLGKVKDLIGIDLNTQKQVAERSRIERETTTANATAAQANTQAQSNA